MHGERIIPAMDGAYRTSIAPVFLVAGTILLAELLDAAR